MEDENNGEDGGSFDVAGSLDSAKNIGSTLGDLYSTYTKLTGKKQAQPNISQQRAVLPPASTTPSGGITQQQMLWIGVGILGVGLIVVVAVRK